MSNLHPFTGVLPGRSIAPLALAPVCEDAWADFGLAASRIGGESGRACRHAGADCAPASCGQGGRRQGGEHWADNTKLRGVFR